MRRSDLPCVAASRSAAISRLDSAIVSTSRCTYWWAFSTLSNGVWGPFIGVNTLAHFWSRLLGRREGRRILLSGGAGGTPARQPARRRRYGVLARGLAARNSGLPVCNCRVGRSASDHMRIDSVTELVRWPERLEASAVVSEI